MKKNRDSVDFTNAKIGFIKGEKGQADGIVSITIGVQGRHRLEEIFWRAKIEGLITDESGCLNMLGVKWRFVVVDEQTGNTSRL